MGVEAIFYSELGEGIRIVAILDPSINGKEYVKSMNEKIEPYNIDIKEFEVKKSAINELHGINKTFEEVTGEERLNEREPKYPAEKPKGFKNIQEACPEITAERERRIVHNQKYRKIYEDFMVQAYEKVRNDLKPLKEELINKWPEFKAWIKSDYSNTIYHTFELTSYKYIKK